MTPTSAPAVPPVDRTGMFDPDLPNFQVAWDSSSLSVFKTCPRKYYYEYILARKPAGQNIHLTFGSAYHKALEIYDHYKILMGVPHGEATFAALQYCLLFQDGPTPDPNKNRKTLVRTVLWYLDHFRNDPLETVQLANGKPAVELSFRLDLNFLTVRQVSGEPLLLCGHIDRLVSFEGQIYYLDRKTTKGSLSQQYFSQFNPNNQMSLYDFATQVILGDKPAVGGIIDAAQILVGGSRFSRAFVTRSEPARQEWLRELDHYLQLAHHFAVAGFWPKNDTSCDKFGGCPFQYICSKPPSIQEKFLANDPSYVHSLWNPLIVRGDI